jgi:alcohol dehydrogenase (cytochrome c)
MRHIRKLSGIAVLAGASAAAIAASAFAAEYSMTVNRDRLINAQNEPQNWLMMNGDYGSMRYSKLTQFNRDNVKNLRMVWALALGGMQDVGQNGPENEVNPLIDNGFMYTTDGWGTVYKIDARNPNKGEFVWISDSGVRHEGNVPRTRGIALWDDLVIANLPDGRVIAINRDSGEIVWDKQVAKANEFGSKEKFLTAPITAEGKVLVANGAGDAQTRGWLAALDVKTGNELWRWYVVPKPGDPGSETWKDKTNAWKTGGGGLWQTGSYDPSSKLTVWGTGNPVPIYDPQRGRATISTPTPRSRSISRAASSPGISSTRRTIRGTTTRTAFTCCTTPRSTARTARPSPTSDATASSTRSIAPTAASSGAGNTSTT